MSFGAIIMTKDRKSNLLSIPSQEEPCPYVIKQLEELLESAKEGKIKNIFFIAEIKNDDPLFIQVGVHDPLKTLGLLEWAKARWLQTTLINYEDDEI